MRRMNGFKTIHGFAVALICVSTAVVAQEEWQWPEKAENLKVFPESTSTRQLRSVMFGFTRSLGVGCSYCHVGEIGSPLTTYDFPSDANPNKDRAREMLRMLKDINEHLKKIEPSVPARVNMWCGTCHRGRPRPTTLVEELRQAYSDSGAAAAVGHYRDLRTSFYGRGTLDFDERSLNSFGYELLRAKDMEGAITIFRLNAEQFPQSANVWDSLAEAYLASGRTELSAIYYRKSLELNPDNENALHQLKKLKTGDE